MKKAIALLTVLLVMCGALAGCASDPDGAQEARDNAPAPSTPALVEFSPVETEAAAPSPTEALPAMQGMGNSSLNILNEGYAVLSDNVLYYADRQNGGNIWRADPDGGNAQMLAEGSFKHLNVSGGRLFFADWSAIYVMPIGETQPRSIRDCWASSLCVLDEWLYYIESSAIYRMQADGSQNTLVAESVGESFQIDGGWIYYLQRAEGQAYHHLWKTALDGSKTARVSDARMRDFLIHEEHVYYQDWERIYGIQKIALDGTGHQEIYDRNVTLYSAADGWIYLHSKPHKDAVDGLYRIRTDGSGRENVAEGHCFNMSIVGEWIFFTTNDEQRRLSKMRLDGSERGFVNE